MTGHEELIVIKCLSFLGYHINIFIITQFSTGVHARIAFISLDPNQKLSAGLLDLECLPWGSEALALKSLFFCAASVNRCGKA